MNPVKLHIVNSQDPVEVQLVCWVREIAKSHKQLTTALQGLRTSYRGLLAGRPITDGERLLLLGVEDALRTAKNVRNMLVMDPDSRP
jgi:hypothetical protein